jgi:hypothetical protein
MPQKLTEQDYLEAAKELNCDVAAIKAVAEVESAGGGFLPDGRPKILFERHIFSRLTKRKWDANYPDISNRESGGYKGGEAEYDRLRKAYELDYWAAHLSCSWGKFQILGTNFVAAGFRSIQEFVVAMQKDEQEHLNAFVNYVEHNSLDDEIREHRWTDFARLYNGKFFWRHKYDVRIAAAHKKFSK